MAVSIRKTPKPVKKPGSKGGSSVKSSSNSQQLPPYAK